MQVVEILHTKPDCEGCGEQVVNPCGERTKTVSFLRGLRHKDGGYADLAADSDSGLQNTLSVLKAMRLLDAAPDDPEATLAFVNRCFDVESGGFSDRPEGKPTVFATAMGLIALHELGAENIFKDRAEAAMRFMTENSVSLSDHFMVIAAHEEGEMADPAPPSAVSFFCNQRQKDGTFGASVRANAIACAALLRAGESVEHPDPVVSRLLGAQRPDGGIADGEGQSDLMTTYAVMRALTLLETTPDITGLADYVTSLRREDGGYRVEQYAPASAGATYQVLSIFRWMAKLQEAMMNCKKIGIFIEDEWVAKSFHTIISEVKKAGYIPILITTEKEWDNGERKSIPSGNELIYRLVVDLSIDKVNIDDFAGFIFGGGYWVDRLRWWFMKESEAGRLERPEPRALVEKILRSEKHLVGVICHAMWLLASLKEAVTAREVTCAYNIIDDVKNAGFTYVDTDVHVDGNLVTGRMSGHSDIFIKEFLYQLELKTKTTKP